MRKNVKIQDVAKFAGVSTATVSRALSNPEVVSKKTLELVRKAVDETGYRVNRVARNLRTQRANAILVLLPDMGNPFFSQILKGIESRLSSAGFSMLIAETTQIEASGEHLVDYFGEGRVDGMIILDGALDESVVDALSQLSKRNNIVCACEWLEGLPFPSVRSANRRGTAEAIEHLYGLGHRKIAHVTGPLSNILTRVRRDSYLETMTRLGAPPKREWVIDGDFTLEAGRNAAYTLLAMNDRPTAVFCASDIIAFGLISELANMGVRVPEQISVVGFDDIELSECFIPPLTTMRQDRWSLGQKAANILLMRINGIELEAHKEIVVSDVRLMERGSTAPV